MDCGAVDNLTGLDSVKRQSLLAITNGFETQWEILAKPKSMSGVGDAAKTCTHQATVYGCLESGDIMTYSAPVIPNSDNGTSPIPSLYGLNSMAKENTYMGMRKGLMAMIPEGTDDQIVWPKGTRFIQCQKAPSGHWFIITSCWHKRKPSSTSSTAQTFTAVPGKAAEPQPPAP